MIRNIVAGAVTAVALVVVLASHSSEAYGQAAQSSTKAYAHCRLKCHDLLGNYPMTCANTPECKSKCSKETGSKDACKACVDNCVEPHKKAMNACIEKCPPPPKG